MANDLYAPPFEPPYRSKQPDTYNDTAISTKSIVVDGIPECDRSTPLPVPANTIDESAYMRALADDARRLIHEAHNVAS